MARELDQDELIDRWTLVEDELALVAGKRGVPGVCAVVALLHREGPVPAWRGEIPDAAVDYVARQVGVSASEVAFYDWAGRTIKAHRVQIRQALGFRECSVADADKLTEWLVTHVTQAERSGERVREGLLARCREERIEPPTSGRIDRIMRLALHRGEELLVARVAGPGYLSRYMYGCSPWSPPRLTTATVKMRMGRRCWRRSGLIRAMSA